MTDGKGWKSARRNLQETFDAGCYVYNIVELENGVLDLIFDGHEPLSVEYSSVELHKQDD